MMKRLGDFTGKEGIEVAVKLMAPVGRLAKGKKNVELNGQTAFEFFSELMEQDINSVHEMMAILSGEDPATFSCTGGEAIKNLTVMVGDDDLLDFFGLQRVKKDSSDTAPENTTG